MQCIMGRSATRINMYTHTHTPELLKNILQFYYHSVVKLCLWDDYSISEFSCDTVKMTLALHLRSAASSTIPRERRGFYLELEH